MTEKPDEREEIEVTPEMIEVGSSVIWRRLADILAVKGESFSLAFEVYRAMVNHRSGYERIPEELWHETTEGVPIRYKT